MIKKDMNHPYSQEKFMSLIMPISKRIQAYVQYLAWNQNDVEDIFQTAILNAFEKFSTFEEGTNFKAWFYKFVTYAAYNFNRKHMNLSKNEVISEAQEILDSQSMNDIQLSIFDDTDQYDKFLKDPNLILSNFSHKIELAMKKLPEKRRSIFLLRSVAELSYKEIASLYEIPYGTVMSEIFRARQLLRKTLCDSSNSNALKDSFGSEEGESNEL